jgi:hypothetical protein
MTAPVSATAAESGQAAIEQDRLDFSVVGQGARLPAAAENSSSQPVAGHSDQQPLSPSAQQALRPSENHPESDAENHAERGSGSAPPAEPPPRMGKRSRFLFSLLLFFFLNATLSFTAPIDFDPYRYPCRNWPWWMVNDLRHDQTSHNVALLGSSLMVSAVAGCDTNYLRKPLDLTAYHKATYFDRLLHTKFGGAFSTVNLSAPGQMPSDAYLILKATVEIAQRPDVVIYGIAPRDFIDSTLSNPAETEEFKYIERVVNVDDVASGLYRTPLPRLEWFLQRSLYLCGKSLDLQMLIGDHVTSAMAYLVPRPTATLYPFTWWDRRKLLPRYLVGEIIPDSMLAMPLARADAQALYKDNTAEYRERYKRPVPGIYQTQLYFLRKLAAYCRREKIELVLVNMPISELNVSLLRPMAYQQYLSGMQVFGFSQDIAFIDLCNWKTFTTEDFHDSVHLNAFGGQKLFDSLIEQCAKKGRVRRALKLAGIQMQASEELDQADHAATGKTPRAQIE